MDHKQRIQRNLATLVDLIQLITSGLWYEVSTKGIISMDDMTYIRVLIFITCIEYLRLYDFKITQRIFSKRLTRFRYRP